MSFNDDVYREPEKPLDVFLRLYQRGFITSAEYKKVLDWSQKPLSLSLPAPLLLIMLEAAQAGASLEKMEEKYGWPARSAKQILKIAIQCFSESNPRQAQRIVPESADETSAREKLEYLMGSRFDDWGPLRDRFKLTPREAKLLHALKTCPFGGKRTEQGVVWGPTVSKDYIMRVLYDNEWGDCPEEKIVDVFVCKIRMKLKDSGWYIKTIWASGYSLGIEVGKE